MLDPNAVGYETLGADINKNKNQDQKETQTGVVSQKLPELTLEMSDEDIVKLTDKWEKVWKESDKKTEWEKQCEDNIKYWKGVQFDTPKADKSRPNVDNAIFESVETYLPLVTKRNPDPIVKLNQGEPENEENRAFVTHLKNTLGDVADKNKLRLKLKRAARSWATNMIGIGKFGWDLDRDIPVQRIIRPTKIILDPEAWIDEDGYTGNRIGEYRKMEADKLLAIVSGQPKPEEAQKKIKDMVGDDVGTQIQFIEWWTPEYMCWKIDKKIIFKIKNPNWNYDKTVQQETVDTFGNVSISDVEEVGINHFETPQMPYRFLVVFNLGDQPMDNTSLIGQNLSNQDRLNKRNRQIDKNADTMNEGMVVSLERSGLTESQAKNVSNALRKGGVVAIPSGSPQEAIYRPSVSGLPADVFNDRNDIRNRMRDIFGTRGSSAAGLESDTTVRGKIMNRGLDTDRIGGGVSEYLEQFADDSYNWFVQLLYVYDPRFKFVDGKRPPKVVISVKEGSLLPKDSTTIANQAIELASAGKMSTIDLYKRLEYPNPEELAANVWLEANAPQLLFRDNPLVQQAIQMQQASAGAVEKKAPSESISFKDLPPEGKVQMADQAGIKLTPEGIAQDAAIKDAKEVAKSKIAKPSPLSEVPNTTQ